MGERRLDNTPRSTTSQKAWICLGRLSLGGLLLLFPRGWRATTVFSRDTSPKPSVSGQLAQGSREPWSKLFLAIAEADLKK